MIALACAPTPIYNTADDKVKKIKNHHWRQHSTGASVRPHRFAMETPKVETATDGDLRERIVKYDIANKKMKQLALWNLRSTKSALKDVQEMLETLEELYGDEAFE
jgi:hypothetical protein|tara:strand:+ start:119 stop:436 length:318 start_codon:yes stop_codon:yes gene_type:complete